jgi:hypothetical protein
VAIVLGVWRLTADGGETTTQTNLNHVAYARLWNATIIGTPKDTVLGRWPGGYQVYPDGARNECFQWFDRPIRLYNLCFKKGVLVTKSIA